TGAWYSYKGDRLGQGKDNVRLHLKENPDLAAELEGLIRVETLPKSSPETEEPAEEESMEAEA
ncbi:MAG: DNA recombination/repair protein RecA, partial [Pseudomonadota bacterium]